MRKEQQAAIDKAVRWFQGGYSPEVIDSAAYSDRFLLNAKMRFGKCFTGIHIAKTLAARGTLIVTYKPEVMSEWIDAIKNHVNFEGWTGIRARRNDENINDPHLPHTGELPKISKPFG